jgi:hypothetical protein
MIDPATLASLGRRKDEILSRIRSLEQRIITVDLIVISEVPFGGSVRLLTAPQAVLNLEVRAVHVHQQQQPHTHSAGGDRPRQPQIKHRVF